MSVPQPDFGPTSVCVLCVSAPAAGCLSFGLLISVSILCANGDGSLPSAQPRADTDPQCSWLLALPLPRDCTGDSLQYTFYERFTHFSALIAQLLGRESYGSVWFLCLSLLSIPGLWSGYRILIELKLQYVFFLGVIQPNLH